MMFEFLIYNNNNNNNNNNNFTSDFTLISNRNTKLNFFKKTYNCN
jgi:hypothetical protein